LKRKIIPYNPHLKEIAKKLRNQMTFSEIKLWNYLKNGQQMGYDFDRQRPICRLPQKQYVLKVDKSLNFKT
jgi:very-short-patch-repair endonuclease